MGRPKALTEALKAEICGRIADGETVRQICADDHMPVPSTVYLALANEAAFSEQYARAREAQLLRWEDELLEIADDGSNDWMERQNGDNTVTVANHDHISRSKVRLDTRKWLMSKRAPKKYGDKLEVGGDGENPVKHEHQIVVTGVRRAVD